ncbi:MAG: hypothetical protein LIO96_03900 [Lachnospiraceae bacterium]|nr:hypothetical protein [Lachnospiraceae bacterium]
MTRLGQMLIEEGVEKGMEKGMLIGREEGKQLGREEGARKATQENIRNLMDTLKLSLDQAMDALKIPPAEREKYQVIFQKSTLTGK